MVTTGLVFANLGQGGANLLPPFIELGLLIQGLLGLRKQAIIDTDRDSQDRTLGTGKM